MDKVMEGQYIIFDYTHDDETSCRPCDYRFRRYIGQRVRLIGVACGDDVKGKVHIIGPYYTIVKTDGGFLMCGTPYNTAPENKEEYYERAYN